MWWWGAGSGSIRVVRNHFQRAGKRPGSRHSCLPIIAKDSASLQIFCWLCVKIRSYYLPTQLNLAEARRLRKEGPWVKCEAVVSMGNEFILN